MSDFDWTERFPEMRPVRTTPPLVWIHGFGCGVYGSRDVDDETGTYVKTFCFSALFLPVLALTAYRVADAPNGGWYFVGRVPLSGFAKLWNLLVLLSIVCVTASIVWHEHTHSADYLAGRKLAEADELAASGQLSRAAQMYGDVAVGKSSHRSDARARITELLDDPRTNDSLVEAVGVYRAAVRVQQRDGTHDRDLEERGVKLIDWHAEADPRGALGLLDILQPIAENPRILTERRLPLLERLVARDPADVPTASALALVYEETDKLPRCEALLLPLKNRLGDSEGARILGQILHRKDKWEDACILLEPYTAQHLPRLRAAEQAYSAARTRLLDRINNHLAPDFPYRQMQNADQAARLEFLENYLDAHMKEDDDLRQIAATYRQARRVVPATLDLGMILLRRAQSRRDPAARQADLKKAEEMFLAIQNDQAAQSSAYRLSLGQVYYWLGKPKEGRKQFDDALTATQRSSEMLLFVARLLREVGATGEARALAEEAYNKEPDNQKKYQAALFCALVATELDDKIVWLQRADPQRAEVKANLCEARAQKAIREGKPTEAEPHLREAIDLYAHQPERAAILNNAALAHLTLYHISGERALLEKAEAMMDKAAALEPSNSILLNNAADSLLRVSVREAIGDFIDLKTLKRSGSRDLLSYLYDDRAGQRRISERLRSHPATVKATSFLERLLILSPKNPEVYRQLVVLYQEQENADKLRDLAARLDKVELDLSAEEKRSRDRHAGKRDEEDRKVLQAQLPRYKKLVEEASKGRRGVTYAVAVNDLIGLQIALDDFGVVIDVDEVVKLAESAYAAAPSFAARGGLEGALLLRATHNLTGKNPAFAALVSRTRRSFSPADWIAFAVVRDGPLRASVLADADVQRTLELIRESIRKAPDVPNEWAWAMLRSDPKDSERMAKVIREDALDALVRTLNVKLAPYSARTALLAAWALEVAGKDKEAAAILQQCAARGVPMP